MLTLTCSLFLYLVFVKINTCSSIVRNTWVTFQLIKPRPWSVRATCFVRAASWLPKLIDRAQSIQGNTVCYKISTQLYVFTKKPIQFKFLCFSLRYNSLGRSMMWYAFFTGRLSSNVNSNCLKRWANITFSSFIANSWPMQFLTSVGVLCNKCGGVV